MPRVEDDHLYRQIAESLRQDIMSGRVRAGDRLPGIRESTVQWGCTQGTVQKAYQELAHQGLVVSRPGQGTHVKGGDAVRNEAPMRWASLVHRAETYLLEVLAAGHTPSEAEAAIRVALDRWRTLSVPSARQPGATLRFVGSHDPAVALIASHADEAGSAFHLEVSFAGSLGGLMALSRGEADVAGSHLWDAETDTYNAPFVRRLLPGRRVALVTLAHRHLGLIVAPGNPLGLAGLADLARTGLRFLNRQRGSGTRVWLDVQLGRLGVDRGRIAGYGDEVASHDDVARAVAEGRADVGLGVEAAALEFGLGFVGLTKERYDLVVLADVWEGAAMQAFASWLRTEPARAEIGGLGGYEVASTGEVEWVEG